MKDLIDRQALLAKKIRIPIARIVTEDKIIYRDVVFVKDIEALPSAETGNLVSILRGKTPEEQYDFMDWLLNDYGRQFTNTRQAVIDWLNKPSSTEPDVVNYKQITYEFDPKVEQWFKDIAQKELRDWQKVVLTNLLPSTEPEIIRCKDCRKHNVDTGWKSDCCPLVDWRGKAQGHEFDYQHCSYGERREDE